ncbi:estrogen receptor beta-like isoform X1 [Lampetra planeri]
MLPTWPRNPPMTRQHLSTLAGMKQQQQQEEYDAACHPHTSFLLPAHKSWMSEAPPKCCSAECCTQHLHQPGTSPLGLVAAFGDTQNHCSRLPTSTFMLSAGSDSVTERPVLVSPVDGPSTQLCSVCGDFSSGYHYGVWTCEGCKAFFKRSVQGKNNFVCPATNHCTIDKTRRRRCQACRLRKCYEAGMIRDDRKGHWRSHRGRVNNDCSLLRYRGFNSDARRGGVRSFGGAVPHAHVEGMGIIHILLETEPPKLLCMRSLGEPLTEASMMTLFTDLATKEMVHIVSWAKKIPGFMELDLPVKTQLLENSWLEVLITGLIWRSMEQQDTLVFASDLVFTRADGSRMEGTMEIFDQLLAIVTHFRELCFRMEEYACLKAMVLLNVGLCSDWMLTEQPDAIKAVCKIMDTVSNALVSFLEHSCLSEGQQFHRLTRLLMLLSHIHQISYRASNKGIQHLTIMKMKHMIPLSTLLTNMLEGAQVK